MENYFEQLHYQVEQVFLTHPDRPNHLGKFPWLIGALGNPQSKIWFVAENPSLTMVERATNPDGSPPTIEAQWAASRGDRLFRDMLVKHGFKDGTWATQDGWQCYITNVIKEADYVKTWRAKTQQQRYQVADVWSSVLRWELDQTKPVLVVTMGQQVARLINHFINTGQLSFPRVEAIEHYSYIAHRPRDKQGPMHPLRVQEYDNDFARISATIQALKS